MQSQEIKNYLKELDIIMNENRSLLIDMDSIFGDGDLGLTMGDGFKAAYDSIKDSDEKSIGKIFYCAGKAMSTAVPSTMGTLMASGLIEVGKTLKKVDNLPDNEIYKVFESYFNGVKNRGKAELGDKTFLDGYYPGLKVFKDSKFDGKSIKNLALKASEASNNGYENTFGMIAKHGRAATRGENSKSLKDPGAYVAYLMFKAFAKSL